MATATSGASWRNAALDGDENTHGLTRTSKKGGDTFRRVFDNLIAASRRIRLAIRGNYQDDTLHGFAPLLDKLAAACLPARTDIRFSPALSGLSSRKNAGSGACTWAGSDTSLQVATPCGGCSHRPNCGGGCVANAWIAAGQTGGVNCEKAYFDRIERDATIRNFLLATAESPAAAVAEFPPAPRALPNQPMPSRAPTRGRRPHALRVVAT